MRNTMIRIKEITIQNFKNVSYGNINFENNNNLKASILGLYGQNGSGKTTLIDAIKLLKYVMMGFQIPLSFSECINVDSNSSLFEFKFEIKNLLKDVIYNVIYSLSIKKSKNFNKKILPNEVKESEFKTEVFNEYLSYSLIKNGEVSEKMHPLIKSNDSSVIFTPKIAFKELIGGNKDDELNVMVAKKIAATTSKSFIFSDELMEIIRSKCKNNTYLYLFNSLINYSRLNLFVFDNASNAMISFDALPLSLRLHNKNIESGGTIVLPINDNGRVRKDLLQKVNKGIENINIVLEQLVPGLTIDIRVTGEQVEEDGSISCITHLVSNKNSREIPLRYESEGIKKMIAILNLLINVYNEPSITVAIDELDSGIFEYLLGELLGIISQKGKGQLIFTSHNLRPLETISKDFVVFTTINPNNRYIRFTNVKKTNNLRDLYYKDIILGGQNETVYEKTNNHEISFALKEAGKIND